LIAKEDTSEDLQSVARQLRHDFQRGLLGYLRGGDPVASLRVLADVLGRLQELSHAGPVECLWWVSRGLINALIEGALQPSVSVKRLIGQIDHQIKRLIDEGEARLGADPPERLLKNLLFYLARSERRGAQVAEIQDAFRLAELLPSEQELAQARERLRGPSRAMLETVATAIKEDVTSVKNVLDLFVRKGMRHPENLAPSTVILRRIADTLRLLSLDIPRSVIQTQTNLLDGLIEGRIEPSEQGMMEIAGALLYVESAVEGLVSNRPLQEQESKVHIDKLKHTGAEGGEEHCALPWHPSQPERPVIDAALFEIFSNEARDHLAVISCYVNARSREEAGSAVSDELLRALHTLHGSAHIAGMVEIAEVSGALEKHANLIHERSASLEPVDIERLKRAMGLIHEILEGQDSIREPQSDAQALIAEIAASCEKLQTLRCESATATEQRLPHDKPLLEADSELLEVFLEEGTNLFQCCESAVQRWELEPEDQDALAELLRLLHTLKGGARMAGLPVIGDLIHALESVLIEIAEGHADAGDEVLPAVLEVLDYVAEMLEQVRKGAVPVLPHLLCQRLKALRAGSLTEALQPVQMRDSKHDEADSAAGAPVSAKVEDEPSQAIGVMPPGQDTVEALREERRTALRVQHETIRVRADLLHKLVNAAGEVSIYRARIDQQVGAFRFNLTEHKQTVKRLREQVRKLEIETEAQILFRYEKEIGTYYEDFDPLELDRFSRLQQLSRALAESLNDLESIQNLLENSARDAETLLLQQAGVNTELQESLMRTRMVPFGNLVPRLCRIVRQTCQGLDKRAELRVVGAQGEMDRTVLDRVTAPLEHMLRNAVSHGIESPERRRAAAKPQVGTITISLSREGSDVVLRIADDGAGINLDAIRRKACDKGLLRDDAELSDYEVMQFILESGFSTAEQVDQISGRGVGMDVVNSEIKQLGGSLRIESVQGKGTTFVIQLPFTLATNQALLIQTGEDVYAIPLVSIDGVVRMRYSELMRFYSGKDAYYYYAGQEYQVHDLGILLAAGPTRLPEPGEHCPVLLVQSADHRFALHVESLLGCREIVVKSVGPQLSTVRGIFGATILGDGRVILILDVSALVRIGAGLGRAVAPKRGELGEAPQASRVTVMVVDDSITMRKVTARFLERHNMLVLTAKDGVDAVAQLHEHVPDIMLLDIEMPRMDGYELAAHVRCDERLKHIPIIMITSRTGEKHRKRAMDIGVQKYLGKPYQESELLNAIQELLRGCLKTSRAQVEQGLQPARLAACKG
jgi:Chemotaxis protein histidine kinase and related kinases